jgi:hypothetical protein
MLIAGSGSFASVTDNQELTISLIHDWASFFEEIFKRQAF